MNTFEITVLPHIAGASDYTVEINDSVCTHADVLENLIEQMQADEIEGAEDCTDFSVIDWANVPEFAQDFDVLSDLMPEYANSSYDIDVYEAAHECDVQFSDVEGAYSGQYSDDEEFAQDMAEQLGAIDKNASWPMNCIDWTFAAKELMYDYSEANGYYFRNL